MLKMRFKVYKNLIVKKVNQIQFSLRQLDCYLIIGLFLLFLIQVKQGFIYVFSIALSSGQTLGVKAQRFRGHTSPHRNVKEKKKLIVITIDFNIHFFKQQE
eukprot:TRINITY_DN4111_c0_g2_i5.p6 TRINITY_DN4111_c0_g2~~TRINITY_DN4111_c0_g2_i5.p6  ORF type:complete len:101 (-),score=6.32 TRINITY_DN4111_c0_g2_i5:542-844(-)